MISSFLSKFQDAGVLSINKRNADFLLPLNARKLYPLVDNKLRTKELAQKAGIAVPELYEVVTIQRQIRDLGEKLSKHSDFVIKPANGTGGEGILVITNYSKGRYRLVNDEILAQDEINFHISNILSGIYSLGGRTDQVMFEYRVKSHSVFEEVSYRGVPDIRIIVFYGVPVMAMVRLPTRKSKGKANLHQGAVGLGINLRDGLTGLGVYEQNIITEHPDTLYSIENIQIPDWTSVLELASKSYELTGLTYQGVDIVLDRDLGPLILELNARPGLGIQLANMKGLLSRLEMIQEKGKCLPSVQDKVAFACENLA